MHEIMISDEEVPYSTVCGEYYAINCMLPEVADLPTSDEHSGLTKEYSSEHSVIGLEATTALLEKHNLMPGDQHGEQQEFLR